MHTQYIHICMTIHALNVIDTYIWQTESWPIDMEMSINGVKLLGFHLECYLPSSLSLSLSPSPIFLYIYVVFFYAFSLSGSNTCTYINSQSTHIHHTWEIHTHTCPRSPARTYISSWSNKYITRTFDHRPTHIIHTRTYIMHAWSYMYKVVKEKQSFLLT